MDAPAAATRQALSAPAVAFAEGHDDANPPYTRAPRCLIINQFALNFARIATRTLLELAEKSINVFKRKMLGTR
jgi:hypothetical protein